MRILKLSQLVKYYSPLLDEEALAVNILFQDYDKFSMNYVFPPSVMIEQHGFQRLFFFLKSFLTGYQ